LALLTLAAYWRSFSADFINFDDPLYLNPQVNAGLTLAGWKWAWTTLDACNWHPLTWLSLQADSQFFGSNPVGFHVTNVLLHLANVLLLFSLLRESTGAWGRSLFVAALFAVHPLHVESVAWVAERKDVLSSLFGLAALRCYVSYARRPTAIRYLAICVLFALSLLAKPMWVTLPAQLLLLDYWPLQRATRSSAASAGPQPAPAPLPTQVAGQAGSRSWSWSWLIVEKIPLAVIAFVSCLVTMHAQQGSMNALAHIPLTSRLENAIVAVVVYLRLTIWPLHLAPYYPYASANRDGSVIAGCGVLLLTITAWLVWQKRRLPALIVGWLWFLGTLVPVIGIVQVGEQAYADRYTYLPHIGLLTALVWWADAGCSRIGLPLPGKQLLGGLILVVALSLTWVQLGYWQNSETLWRHAVSVTQPNANALNNLGTALTRNGKFREAVACFEKAVELQPKDAWAQYNLGNAWKDQGQPARAEPHLRESLRMDVNHPQARQALGVTLGMLGRADEAIEHLTEATRQNPQEPGAWYNLGVTLAAQGKFAAAISSLETAAALQPSQAPGHAILAWARYETGDPAAARRHYLESLRLDPNWPANTNRAAWMLGTSHKRAARNGVRAVQLAQRVCQATDFQQAEYVDTLAAAYAEAGRFTEAMTTIDKALALLEETGAPPSRRAPLQSRREKYLRHEAFHESDP
jgi:tetratricopeptide (TPR) repeat protein